MPPVLVWLRHDLRLADHPALAAAAACGAPVVPVFVWAPQDEGRWAPGAASRVWLHHSLAALDAALRRKGSRLILRHGPTIEALARLRHEKRATAIFYNRRYEPGARALEGRLLRELGNEIELRAFPGNLLGEPDEIKTRSGGPYQVFTPYYHTAARLRVPELPLAAPRRLKAPARWPRSAALGDLDVLPRSERAGGIVAAWHCGESAARRRLRRFVDRALAGYEQGRDRLAEDATSRLSPHLHFGELTPHQIWRVIDEGARAAGAEAFRRQLFWREFAYHLLVHFPRTPEAPLRPEFARFPWTRARAGLRAWERGETGYPIVDAAMRQLWQTGWMHNRARMIAASFLVKDLGVRWQSGARWFWDALVDADLANNTFGWQWVAGCGADAAPFFRIFNPVLQGKKFDPAGEYVRRYLPVLRRLPDAAIHAPWAAPSGTLAAAGVVLGKDYPLPVVDHAEARDRALLGWSRIKHRR